MNRIRTPKKRAVTASDVQLSDAQQRIMDQYRNSWRPVETEVPAPDRSGRFEQGIFGVVDANNEDEAEALIGALWQCNVPCIIRYMADCPVNGTQTQWAGFSANVHSISEPLVADKNMGLIAQSRGDLGAAFKSMRYQVVAWGDALEEKAKCPINHKIACADF